MAKWTPAVRVSPEKQPQDFWECLDLYFGCLDLYFGVPGLSEGAKWAKWAQDPGRRHAEGMPEDRCSAMEDPDSH